MDDSAFATKSHSTRVGGIKTGAVARAAWTRTNATFHADSIYSFVEVNTPTAQIIEGPHGVISDPTPYFKDGELSTLWSWAQAIARDLRNGKRVLVLCKGGKNRSAFLAGLVKRILARDSPTLSASIELRPPVDPHLIHLLSHISLLEKCVEVDQDSDVHELL